MSETSRPKHRLSDPTDRLPPITSHCFSITATYNTVHSKIKQQEGHSKLVVVFVLESYLMDFKFWLFGIAYVYN